MDAKKAAAEKAVEEVKEGMTVGLGSGSTAYFAIQAIGEKVRRGLNLKAVASSVASERLATEAGIRLTDFSSIKGIDLYIDGADEVDEDFYLTKGGGGALVREKILAANSNRFIVIVDESKLVKKLGRFPLAVEIIPFAANLTVDQLKNLGCSVTLRKSNEQNFVSDNGNLIADCSFETINNPAELNARINTLPGVVDCGLFHKSMVDSIVAGYENGSVKVLK